MIALQKIEKRIFPDENESYFTDDRFIKNPKTKMFCLRKKLGKNTMKFNFWKDAFCMPNFRSKSVGVTMRQVFKFSELIGSCLGIFGANLKTSLSETSKQKLEKMYYGNDKKYSKILNMEFSWLKNKK